MSDCRSVKTKEQLRKELMHRLPAVGAVMIVAVALWAGCSDDGTDAPEFDTWQSQLAQLSVTFNPADSGNPAASNDHIVNRASRGSGLLARNATWVWSGELTAQGDQGQNLVDQPMWAVYYPSIEQPMLGAPGIATNDWFVFVDVGTDNVVLASSLTTAVTESSEGQTDSPVFTSPPPPLGERAGMAAQVMGTVLLDDTGCLVLELEGVRYAVVWPAGTSWQPDPPAVLLPDGLIVEPGMSILGEGGYLSSVTHMTGQKVNDAATACTGPTGEIAIFNLGSEIAITNE